MIPPFTDSGVLPPGIHAATLDEIEARFGIGGIDRIVLNGSFVTDIIEPNDVDCVLLIGREFPKDLTAEADLIAGLPFLDIAIVLHTQFDILVDEIFAENRYGVPKGMIEVII